MGKRDIPNLLNAGHKLGLTAGEIGKIWTAAAQLKTDGDTPEALANKLRAALPKIPWGAIDWTKLIAFLQTLMTVLKTLFGLLLLVLWILPAAAAVAAASPAAESAAVLQAFHAHDYDAVMGKLSDSFSWYDSDKGFLQKPAFRAYMEDWHKRFPQGRMYPGTPCVGGKTVIVEWEGTTGAKTPEGWDYTVWGAIVHNWDEAGKLKSGSLYYNPAHVTPFESAETPSLTEPTTCPNGQCGRGTRVFHAKARRR